MRRFLSFVMASAIMLAGLALAAAEVVRAEGIRPFLLVGVGLMIGGGRAYGWLMSLSAHGDGGDREPWKALIALPCSAEIWLSAA